METLYKLSEKLNKSRNVLIIAFFVCVFMWLPKSFSITISVMDDSGTTQISASDSSSTVNLSAMSLTPEVIVTETIKDVEEESFYLLDKFVPKQDHEIQTVEYVRRFHKVAQEEEKKYGIPASVTLAQGLLESGKGLSFLATEANNHFGIKCFSRSCAPGHCVNRTDDSHKDFFVKYSNAWESYRAHSKFLHKKRYKPCFKSKDYAEWCDCLKAKGYATDPNYATKLKKKIRQLKLYQFDL